MAIIGSIKPVTSYQLVLDDLTDQFKKSPEPKRLARLVGLVFARRPARFVQEHVLPHVTYWHHRSGDYVTFYVMGYWTPSDDADTTVDAGRWEYSDAMFDELRREVELRSRWRYSGGTDFILTNARYGHPDLLSAIMGGETERGWIDFSSALVVNLESLVADKFITAPSALFEHVFQYAENARDDDPAFGFSDALARKLGTSALRRILLAVLPNDLKHDAGAAFEFRIRDVSKRRLFSRG